MKMMFVLAALFALSGCFVSESDFWVEVDLNSVSGPTRIVEQASDEPVEIRKAYAFGRHGTLVCGLRGGVPFSAYVDEQGRMALEKIEGGPEGCQD